MAAIQYKLVIILLDAFMPTQNKISFLACKPIEEHAKLIMDWRNDPHTLKMSYHTEAKTWPAFYKEYCDTYFSHPEVPPLFAVLEGKKFGFIRLEVLRAGMVNLSINIAPDMRGQGLGLLTLEHLSNYLKNSEINHILAEVKQENSTSLNMFLRAGYELLDQREKFIEDIQQFFKITRLIKSINTI